MTDTVPFCAFLFALGLLLSAVLLLLVPTRYLEPRPVSPSAQECYDVGWP